MSEIIIDKTAGINGGFEIMSSGLPVNWLVYSPNTVEESEFTITADNTTFIEGKQSLRFDIKSCSATGGRYSPGIAKEVKVSSGESYQLSFKVLNFGSEFKVKAGGVSPKNGNVKTILHTKEDIQDWKRFSYEIPVTEEFNSLRIEFNILDSGVFHIDDVSIEKAVY